MTVALIVLVLVVLLLAAGALAGRRERAAEPAHIEGGVSHTREV